MQWLIPASSGKSKSNGLKSLLAYYGFLCKHLHVIKQLVFGSHRTFTCHLLWLNSVKLLKLVTVKCRVLLHVYV